MSQQGKCLQAMESPLSAHFSALSAHPALSAMTRRKVRIAVAGEASSPSTALEVTFVV
jgi:hypothetical protein